MRDLYTVKTADGVQIVDRQPGPYSHSAPKEVVVFEMTAEEAKQLAKNNKGGEK